MKLYEVSINGAFQSQVMSMWSQACDQGESTRTSSEGEASHMSHLSVWLHREVHILHDPQYAGVIT